MAEGMQKLLLDDKNQLVNKPPPEWCQTTHALILERIKELEIRYEESCGKVNQSTYTTLGITNYNAAYQEMTNAGENLENMHKILNAHFSDWKKMKRSAKRQRRKTKIRFVKRIEDFQRYKAILSLLQNPEVKEAFRTETHGAIKLMEEQLDYLCWLNDEINPTIYSVENPAKWQEKIHESAMIIVNITLGTDEKIVDFRTGASTKRLLDQISKCEFFKTRTVWQNSDMFNRMKANMFGPSRSNSDVNNECCDNSDDSGDNNEVTECCNDDNNKINDYRNDGDDTECHNDDGDGEVVEYCNDDDEELTEYSNDGDVEFTEEDGNDDDDDGNGDDDKDTSVEDLKSDFDALCSNATSSCTSHLTNDAIADNIGSNVDAKCSVDNWFVKKFSK